MWGRFKRRVSRGNDNEVCTTSQPSGVVETDIVLTNFRRIPSSELGHSSNQNCLLNDEMVRSAGPVLEEPSTSCKCSPLLNFHKHLFGSLRSRQKSNGNVVTGKRTSLIITDSHNRPVSVREDVPNGGSDHAMSSSQNDVQPKQSNNKDLVDDCFNPVPYDITPTSLTSKIFNTDNAESQSSHNGKSEISGDQEVVTALPPRLLRREKSRNGEVSETRKSRLSARWKENNGCSVVVPKPCESLPDAQALQSPGMFSDSQTNDVVGVLPDSSQFRSRDILTSGSSVSDFGRNSTEPSTAESTDSGIQPSLYSSNDDRGHSSGPDDEDGGCLPHTNGNVPAHRSLNATIGANLSRNCDGCRHLSTPNDFCGSSAVTTADHIVTEMPGCTALPCHIQGDVFRPVKVAAPFALSEMQKTGRRLNDPEEKSSSKGQRADYVPVDGSVLSKFSHFELHTSHIGDKYASVPKTDKQDEMVQTEASLGISPSPLPLSKTAADQQWTAVNNMDRSLDSSLKFNGIAHKENTAKEATWTCDSKPVDVDVDSDDGEYLPPLPSRNYASVMSRSCNDAAFAPMCHSDNSWSVEVVPVEEKTHMSWDEVMKEAHALGIPLSAPRSETSDWKSTSSIASSEVSDYAESPPKLFPRLDRMSSSEIQPSVHDPDMLRNGSPYKSAVSQKCTSPFKDKFRLQDFFSKKKGRKYDMIDRVTNDFTRPVQRHVSAAAEIQRRNLPPLPPKRYPESGYAASGISRNSLDYYPVSSEPTRHRAHRTMSTLTLPSRDSASMLVSGSVWGGSSVSVASHGGMSASGISTGSVASINSQQGDGTQQRASGEYDSTCSNVDFIQSFSKLRDCGWYWGPLGWEEAEMKLADKPDGSFLVRDSSDDRYILSLSFRSQGVTHHTRIEHYKGQFSFFSQPKSHGAASIVDFMERAMAYSRSGQFLYFLRPNAPGHAPAPVQLLHPVSRLNTVPPLQHLCRFVIAGHVRRDLIDLLPTPPSLKEYLKQTQYYAMT